MNRVCLYIPALLIFTCLVITESCSQTTDNSSGKVQFVGSTPCDPLIKTLLKIAAGSKCDFIKWDLMLDQNQTNSNQFQLSLLYGEAQPNTNGFYGGGTKIELSGKYNITNGASKNTMAKVFQLNCNKLQSPIFLVEMDSNIFHFVDQNKNLLVGNGGWGYVLNKTKN